MKPSIEHFTHPGHSLAEVYGSEEFRCDGCKTLGNGLRYRCHTCNFNMHEYCGVCPSTLSTFMHPHHHLKLVIGTQGRRNNEGFCDLCGDNVEGLFYRCTLCDFDIHPLCAKLPEYVPHALHPTHPLKLQTSSPGWCTVCKSECTSWRYGCRTCSFDIHLECILAQCDASTTSRSVAAPAPWGWDFYGGQAPHVAYHGLAPYGAYHGLAPYGTYHGPAPYGTYHGPSLYYAYGTQHPYCSSTTPPPHCPSPAHFGAYVHPYAYAPPPPYSYGVATPPPPTNYGAAPPPPSYGVAPPPPPPPPCHGAYAHGESPGFSPHGANHSVSEAQGSGKPSKGGKRLGKIIYSLVGNLTIGLLCGMIFGI